MKKEGKSISCKLTWNQLKDGYNSDQTCSSQKDHALPCGMVQRQKDPERIH